MFARILKDSFLRRRRRKLIAITSVALGAAVATAMLAIAIGIGDKVKRELRAYGANIEVVPLHRSISVNEAGLEFKAATRRSYIDQRDLPKLKSIFWANNILAFAPFLEVPVNVTAMESSPVVRSDLTGTWFDEESTSTGGETSKNGVRQVSPWWSLEGDWPQRGECLIGVVLAESLRARIGQELRITPIEGKDHTTSILRVAGLVTTGGGEDKRLFANLDEVQQLGGLVDKLSRIEISALTNPEDEFARSNPATLSPEERERWTCTPYALSIAHDIQQSLPGTEAHPVLRVSQTEGLLFSKIDLLMISLTLAALIASLLGVASSMTTTVLERKPEIGLLKAIGASNLNITSIFLAEASLIGALGGATGFAVGYVLAQVVARAVFGSAVEVSGVLAPLIIAISVAVAFGGSVWPLRTALKFQPSVILREG